MPPEEQVQANVDLTTDIVENEGQIAGQQGTDTPLGEDASVRQLLEQAAKVDETGRAHGPDGKFVAKPGEEAATTEPPAQAVPTEQVAVGSQFQFTPEYQAMLSSLPDEVRGSVVPVLEAREAAISNYVQSVEARVTGYAGIEQVIGPRRQAWTMAGIAPETALNQLFALSDFATRSPQEFIEWFAGNNNIDLSAVGETFVPPDPQYAALTNQIGQLTNVVNQLTSGRVDDQQKGFVTAVQQFEQEVDASGGRVHPHFQTVSNDMLALIPVLKQQFPAYSPKELLGEAYTRAVYANPTTRQSMLSTQAAREAADRVAAAQAAARAGSSLAGTGPGSDVTVTAVQQADTVRGALEAAFAMHQ